VNGDTDESRASCEMFPCRAFGSSWGGARVTPDIGVLHRHPCFPKPIHPNHCRLTVPVPYDPRRRAKDPAIPVVRTLFSCPTSNCRLFRRNGPPLKALPQQPSRTIWWGNGFDDTLVKPARLDWRATRCEACARPEAFWPGMGSDV